MILIVYNEWSVITNQMKSCQALLSALIQQNE